MNEQKLLSAYLLLILSALIWSGNYVIGRIVHTEVPPFTFSFYRWLLVIIILLPVKYHDLIKSFSEIKKYFISLLVLSLLGITINSSFVYLGLNFTTVLNTSLISAIIPVLIIFLSFFFLGDSLSHYKIFGVIFSFLGVIFILLKGNLHTISEVHYQFGDFFILISTISWALFSVTCKKVAIKISPFLFLLVTAIIGDVFLLPFAIIEQYNGHLVHYNLLSLSSILYAALFTSVLAMTFWNIGLRVAGPSMAAHFFNLLPVFGSILSILFLGETIHLYHLFGGLFVLLGVLLATMETRIKSIFTKFGGCPKTVAAREGA